MLSYSLFQKSKRRLQNIDEIQSLPSILNIILALPFKSGSAGSKAPVPNSIPPSHRFLTVILSPAFSSLLLDSSQLIMLAMGQFGGIC